jgi:hypothetical protein
MRRAQFMRERREEFVLQPAGGSEFIIGAGVLDHHCGAERHILGETEVVRTVPSAGFRGGERQCADGPAACGERNGHARREVERPHQTDALVVAFCRRDDHIVGHLGEQRALAASNHLSYTAGRRVQFSRHR